MRWLLLILMPAVLLVACSDDSGELVARDIVSEIPWTATGEKATYRLLQGDEVKGTGVLAIGSPIEGGGPLRLQQSFEIPEENITDEVSVSVDFETLRPLAVARVIDGPEGKRECQASYSERRVVIDQKAGQDERKDELDVPAEHYESWSDLFLWRTIEFFEGNEVKYVDVLSCSLAKPDLLSIVLKVKEIEEVTVPAGTFQAWRLEIRSGGRTQKAWYADDARRTLVRYDNGDLVFELESID